MNLFTQTIDNFSNQLAEGVSLNTDIFEANLINLIILTGGLFYALSGALSESLLERQQTILKAVQESEEELFEAVSRLADSERQLAQSQVIVDSIGEKAKATVDNVKSTSRAKQELDILEQEEMYKRQSNAIQARITKEIFRCVAISVVQVVTWTVRVNMTDTLQLSIFERYKSKLA
jgi:F-type H+-transporting ATPase subunit b